MAGILYLAKSISSKVTIYGKDRAMKKAKHTVAELEQRIRELEAEKVRLETTLSSSPVVNPHHTLS